MDESTHAIIWFIAGLAVMVLELFLPGGIALFLGLSAVLVGTLIYLGVVQGLLPAFTVWFIGSLALLFGLRGVFIKLFPFSIEKGKTNEDLDAYNQIVEVAETIPAKGEGRIIFRGSTWNARNYHQDRDLIKGNKVRLVFRENLVWVVESLRENEMSNP